MDAAFRVCEFRRSATLFGIAKGSKPTIWHDSPPGCAARQRSRTGQHSARRRNDHREGMTMLKFAHLTLRVMRGLDPRIHEAGRRRKPYVVSASSWIAGSSPAMTNVGSAFGETNPRSSAIEQFQWLMADQAKQPSS